MTTYLITRHPGAVEWIARQGVSTDAVLTHLDSNLIQAGDTVIGTLPVHLAAAVCERGGKFISLTLDLPLALRGRELMVDDLDACCARLEPFIIKPNASTNELSAPTLIANQTP